MKSTEVFVGVLSGGAGTRLWPVSRKSYPKQFYNLAGPEPLLIETLRRVENLGALSILTTKQLGPATTGLLNRYKIKAEILAEPQPLNTAPIIALYNEIVFRKNPDAVVVILPADHTITPLAKFQSDLQKAIATAESGKIVTFGIQPKAPETSYGYLKIKDTAQGTEVDSFLEKPDAHKAKELIAQGALWNSGIFVFKAGVFREALKKYAKGISDGLGKLENDLSNVEELYKTFPSISVDYALMEKVSPLACVKASFDWSDLGSWEAVANFSQDKAKNIFELGAEKNFYTSSDSAQKTVAFIGTKNLMAIDTPDALLILDKGHGQDVKALVDKIKAVAPKVTEDHAFEDRPWGRFEIFRDTPYFKSKLITVWSGQRLSYQSHKFRMEHWIIVSGVGDFMLNDEVTRVKAGDHLFIPLGAKHRISNPGEEKLEFVEVQIGTYFGEDDIIRYDDDYGRK